MRRWLALGGAGLFAIAGAVLWKSGAAETAPSLPPPPPPVLVAGGPAPALNIDAPAIAPAAPERSPRSREERRFARYDKDRDVLVSRAEFLASRQKAFAKLDRDGNGELSFDEYAARTITRFEGADGDGSDGLDRAEFASTRIERKAKRECPREAQPEGEA